jgi:hypothetical protein
MLLSATTWQPMVLARQRPSLIEIPVQLDPTPAFEAAENLVPRQNAKGRKG